MTGKVRVGVLGMAHDHLWTNLKDLLKREDAELVGAADLAPQLRERFRERTDCAHTFEQWDELLDKQAPDAVYAFGATATHAEVVESCAERGIHVMVEKPMAATLAQADRMLVAARKHKIHLMVNWPTAWSRSIRTAYRLVQEGRIGRVWQVTWRGGHSGPDELGCSEEFCQFLFDHDQNGAGAFNDYGGYGSCLCVLFMGGSPTSVIGMAGRLTKDHLSVDDNGVIVMRYPRGMCRIEMTWSEAVPHVPPHDPVIYGTEGTLVAGENVTLYTRQDKDGSVINLDELPEAQGNATEHFLHCIRTGSEPQFQTSAELSRAAQEIMEGGLRSAVSGVEVSLPIEDHLFRV
ncbi:MAG: Gfo/Idh/MocA family oxidoreductase [Gemmatimonadetes bacterium]|jgi:predicted dehydrogenase|nr:Gfo/Idh/MocA family oxidoreductase [Gemmatimonadota bacterium]MBT7863674.1 Gfo/Idh/MocA family oxidoreductase [Gemmatimonadota bacterium]